MGNWQFFLQKVGDKNWSRVETLQPEIPNGRYYIAAWGAHRPHEIIDVKISATPTQETSHLRQTRSHSCQLDGDGFGILAHKLRLTPGIWKLQCCGDILSELMGEDWQVTLTLSVDWQFEPIVLSASSHRPALPQAEDDLETLRSRLDQDADQMLEEIVTEFFPTVVNQQQPFPNSLTSEKEMTSQGKEIEHQYSLQLDQDSFIAQTNKPIIISGQITTEKQPPHPKLRLKIVLRDPRTGEIVAQLFPRLREEPFPRTFCYSLSVPPRCDSHVLQGEISLCEGTIHNNGKVFASGPFTVSTNWENLQPALTDARHDLSDPPAPLSPLSAKDTQRLQSSFPRWEGIFPPQLSRKGKKKKATPPTLPKLPNATATKPKKEYVWSKPGEDRETPMSWDLIEELVVISKEKTEEK